MPRNAPNLTPEQRRLRAQAGAYASHVNHTGSERTAAARAAQQARFEREVDPDGTLPPDERARRAELARKAHMARVSLASAQARTDKRERAAIMSVLGCSTEAWSTPSAVAAALEAPELLVADHLRCMARAGIIERRGRRAVYRLAPG